jgi:hypothetical protein
MQPVIQGRNEGEYSSLSMSDKKFPQQNETSSFV